MDREDKPKRNPWLAGMLKKKERNKKVWEPHGLSRGESKRPLPKQKPHPPKVLRDFLDC